MENIVVEFLLRKMNDLNHIKETSQHVSVGLAERMDSKFILSERVSLYRSELMVVRK